MHLHLDFETFSEADLKKVGAFRYANDLSSAILCMAVAADNEEPVIWWPDVDFDNELKLERFWAAFYDPEILIYAHNAQFEMAICIALFEKTFGIPCPDLSRFRCTASLARRAALPAKLETLALTLGLQNLKDNKGKALIRKFSVMQPAKEKPTKRNPHGVPARRIYPKDEPEAFAQFMEYCRQDVRVEQEVARRLRYFDDDLNNRNYSLDAVINARGVTVNLDGLRKAQKIVDEETAIVSQQFRELVGFEITQNARILEWLQNMGIGMTDLQAETTEQFLEENS